MEDTIATTLRGEAKSKDGEPLTDIIYIPSGQKYILYSCGHLTIKPGSNAHTKFFFFCYQKGPVSSFFSCLGGVSPTCLFKTDLSLTVRCFPSISFVQHILVRTHPLVTFTHIHYSHSLPYILRHSIHSSQSLLNHFVSWSRGLNLSRNKGIMFEGQIFPRCTCSVRIHFQQPVVMVSLSILKENSIHEEATLLKL